MSKSILKIKEQIKKEKNLKLLKISEKYTEYISRLNNEKKSSSKNFYIVIKEIPNKNLEEIKEEIIKTELNDKFLKIKECLSRCGNSVTEINTKEELKNILFTFLNARKNFL